MFLVNFAFYIFSFVMLASALVVVVSKNPVHSVLFLILAFFSSAGIFALLGAELIAMLMVIVYVGAVAVLFLFVVMMLNIDFVKLRSGFIKNLPLAIIVAIVITIELFIVLNKAMLDRLNVSSSYKIADGVNNVDSIGEVLYTSFFAPFQISGLILLIAMIGAITLTLRVRSGVRKQNIAKQVARKKEDSIEIVKVKSGEGV